MKPTRPCACGCGDQAKPGRKYLIGHNRRGVSRGPEKFCNVDGCDRKTIALDMCSKHYKALREYPECAADDCDRPASQSTYCYAHYNRLRRHGDPERGGPLRKRATNGEGCITPDGYRAFTVKGQRVYEHRAVMEKILGRPLLDTENVHHINGQRADNHPENLELWTTYQPYGQRVADLVQYVARHYADEVLAAIEENKE